MAVYVVLKKRKEQGIFLPNFESYDEEPTLADPKHKLLTLEDGDCVDVAKFNLSQDLSYLHVMQFRVSNLNGKRKEEMTEDYTLPRHGRIEV